MIQIVDAYKGDNLKEARELFKEYAVSLGISLDFQDFDEELATLPAGYAPPEGLLLVSTWR